MSRFFYSLKTVKNFLNIILERYINITNLKTQMLMEIFEKLNELLDQLGINYEIVQEDDQIKIKIEDNKKDEERKAEFEALVKKLDDDLFIETMKGINKENLTERYNEDPEDVYEEFLQEAVDVLEGKISELENLIDDFKCFLEA